MSIAIQAKGLRFDLNYPALNIDIPAKSLALVIGATGRGKSNLMLTLAGINQAKAGEVAINGSDPFAGNEKDWLSRRPKIAYVLPSRALVSHLNVIQNIMLPLTYHGLAQIDEAQEIAIDMMRRLNISCATSDLPAECDEAQQRLVTLARALVLKPNILFVDQAFAHLDAITRKQFVQMYTQLIDDLNLNVVLASKDMMAVATLAESVNCQQTFIFLANQDILCFDRWSALTNSTHSEIRNYLDLHLPTSIARAN